MHKHTFTTETSFSLAYTITLTSSPLSHISLRPYIHRRVKCINTRKQRLQIIFFCRIFDSDNFRDVLGQKIFLKRSVLVWTVMNLPDLPVIWYAFQRGWHGSFTVFNALVIECFLNRSFKSGSFSPTIFPAFLWIYLFFVCPLL